MQHPALLQQLTVGPLLCPAWQLDTGVQWWMPLVILLGSPNPTSHTDASLYHALPQLAARPRRVFSSLLKNQFWGDTTFP